MPTLVPTPWIPGPPKVGEMFLQGYGQGAQAAEANARIGQAQAQLAAQQQQTAMEIELKKEQLAQQSRLALQKAEIEKAYRTAQIGLANQRLEQQRSVNDLKIKQVANRYAAQQRIGQRIAAGEDQYKVMLEEGAVAGLNMPQVSRAMQTGMPKSLEIKEQGTEKFYRSSPTERYQHIPTSSASMDPYTRLDLNSTIKQINEDKKYLRDHQADMDDESIADLKNKISMNEQKLNALYQAAGKAAPSVSVGPDWSKARTIGKFKVIAE